MNIHMITARDLPDLWFQAVNDILDKGRSFIVDQGSFAGQQRLEYDYFIGHIKFPGTRSLLPEIPQSIGIPNPVEEAYINGGEGYDRSYVEYIMSPRKEPGESYTYGERLTQSTILGDKRAMLKENNSKKIRKNQDTLVSLGTTICVNQIEMIIETYKKFGHRNNQMVLQIAEPTDILLIDPPCLRSIDTRIQDGKLNFIVYFRSWDLWGGLPANLAGIQCLKEYMADAIGVDDGEMLVESKGLHIYGYAKDLAKMRCLKG